MFILQLFQILPTLMASRPNAPTAYIDPNTGGMLFQLLAVLFAAFSGILFFFSRQIKTGFARLRRKLRGEPEPAEERSEQGSDQEPTE